MADLSVDDLKARLTAQRTSGDTPLAELRAALEASSAKVRIDAGIVVEKTRVGDRPAEWLRPTAALADSAVLYLHGGAFVGGSPNSHRPLAAAIASASRVATLVLDYRLAPEHPWPAAELDAWAAYLALREQGISSIAVAGDSAGGNLAMAVLLRAKAEHVKMPKNCVLLSPWIDLDLKSESVRSLASVDPTLRADQLARFAGMYRNGKLGLDILNADLTGLCPILIQVGGDEILRDDSVRLAASFKAASVPVTLEVGPGLFHVWQAFAPWLEEGRQAIARIGGYVNQIMSSAGPRIPPLQDEEMTKAQSDLVAPYTNDGRIDNVFRTMVQHPDLMRRWLPFVNHVLAKSTLSLREREILILRIGWRCRSEYEWVQHVRAGRRAGLSETDIAHIAAGHGLDGKESLLLKATDELHDGAKIGAETWNALAGHYSRQQLMDIVFTVGQYAMVSMALNSFEVEVDEELKGSYPPIY
jgi:acetyl esterase/lipase/alkylhydroperoxidase family enzyme